MGLYYGTMAMAKGARERQPSRAPGHQALGLRPSLPVRMADPPTNQRRPFLYLLGVAVAAPD
ncbi:hypothetical protein SBA6_1130034 [Candidatus Sulfopaludibacter sp. SbA6]|nr:hypothetical protein SBA6_1130034 [Candidatus Sulfopaludibacter sp. SbA6]